LLFCIIVMKKLEEFKKSEVRVLPYKLFWSSIPLLLLLILLGPYGSFDLQLHSTYIVFASSHFILLLSVLFFLFGGIYFFLKNSRLIKWMVHLHVLLTILPFFLLIVIIQIGMINIETGQYKLNATTFVISFMLVVFAQLVFPINLLFARFWIR